MKKIIPILTAIIILFSCNENKQEERKGGVVFNDTTGINKIQEITSHEEFKANRGKPKPPVDTTVYVPPPVIVVPPPPPVIDTNWIELKMPTPLKQQYGECVAFSTVYAARTSEYYYKTGILMPFSPSFVFYYAKFVFDPASPCTGGTSIQTALDVMVNKGVCSYASMPYTGDCMLAPTQSQIDSAAKYKITGYSKISRLDSNAIKYELSQHHPVIVSMSVDNSFVNAKAGFIWRTYISPVLGHAFTICGYNEKLHLFKIINSFGTTWGDSGFLSIDQNIIYQHAGTYCYVIN